jgi:hypothetical protein
MERILPKEIVDDLTKPGKAFLGYGVPNPKVNDMPEEPPSAAREIPTPSCYPAHLPGAQLGNRPSTRLPQGPGTSLSESPMGLFESLSLKCPETQVMRHDLDLDHAERGCQRQRCLIIDRHDSLITRRHLGCAWLGTRLERWRGQTSEVLDQAAEGSRSDGWPRPGCANPGGHVPGGVGGWPSLQRSTRSCPGSAATKGEDALAHRSQVLVIVSFRSRRLPGSPSSPPKSVRWDSLRWDSLGLTAA